MTMLFSFFRTSYGILSILVIISTLLYAILSSTRPDLQVMNDIPETAVVYDFPSNIRENPSPRNAGSQPMNPSNQNSLVTRTKGKSNKMRSSESTPMDALKNTPDYWGKEVSKSVDREINHPFEMMQVDRYYWYHYLVEVEPDIE